MCTLAETGGRTRVRLRSSVVRPRAAGASWTSRTSSAAWAARDDHTSVIDSSGTIYVIGGYTEGSFFGGTYHQDVWTGTNSGASCLAAMGGRTRVRLRSSVVRPRTAGVTWSLRAASAAWGGRSAHTSVIDSTGAIYVIGGSAGSTYYQDVWVSTNGGADRTRGG
jgi:hypothetical protein